MLKVACACIIYNQQILITQRGPDSDHPWLWEFPGGKIKKNESAEFCIKREIREELNMKIEILKPMVPVKYDYGIKKVELVPFLCHSNSIEIQLNEHIDYLWVGWDKLRKQNLSGADRKLIEGENNRRILKEYLRK